MKNNIVACVVACLLAATAYGDDALDRSSSLAGPDVNNNGVRDDVEAYINQTWTDAKENKAVMQFAKAIQSKITVDLKDRAAVRKADNEDTDAIKCLGDTFAGHNESVGGRNPKRQKAFDEIRAMTNNTMVRVRAYFAFDKAMDGTVISFPQTDTCEK